MDKNIDFDAVARWYDAYVQVDFDKAFWVERLRLPGGAGERVGGFYGRPGGI